MNRVDFDLCREALAKLREKLLQEKGPAYSGNEDVFANFKRNGKRLKSTKYQVWATYAMKHIDAICESIANNPEAPVDKSEGMRGRILDAMNYLELLAGMLAEDQLMDLRRKGPAKLDVQEDQIIPADELNKRLVLAESVLNEIPDLLSGSHNGIKGKDLIKGYFDTVEKWRQQRFEQFVPVAKEKGI